MSIEQGSNNAVSAVQLQSLLALLSQGTGKPQKQKRVVSYYTIGVNGLPERITEDKIASKSSVVFDILKNKDGQEIGCTAKIVYGRTTDGRLLMPLSASGDNYTLATGSQPLGGGISGRVNILLPVNA